LQGNSPTNQNILNPEKWVDLHGDCLYRFAITRIRNPQLAENAVQETFLAALKSKDRFQGKSSERTWLIGILKHKILDYFRKQYKEIPVTDLQKEQDAINSFFDVAHDTVKRPVNWEANPKLLAENNEFWIIFEQCLKKLPKSTATAFSLRELDKMETEEICKILNVTTTNLWVILHRARLSLKKCLETNWFVK